MTTSPLLAMKDAISVINEKGKEYAGETKLERQQRQFKELMLNNELIMQENKLLTSYIERQMARHGYSDHSAFMAEEKNSQSNKKKKGAKPKPQECSTALKLSICEQELALKQSELNSIEQKASKDIADLTAMLGETKIRIQELKKETYEFKRDIVMGAENSRTRKIMAEKVIKYFEEKIRSKETLCEKIKVKNAALKAQIQKLDFQLKQKEDQGESLHSIDFHQLKIENGQFNQKVKEKNNELLQLKMTTGKTVQRLNTAKRHLNETLSSNKALQESVASHESTIVKLTQELEHVEEEIRRTGKKKQKFAIQSSNAEVPQVLDYVNQKRHVDDLRKDLANWSRKQELVTLMYKKQKALFSESQQLLQQRSGLSQSSRFMHTS